MQVGTRPISVTEEKAYIASYQDVVVERTREVQTGTRDETRTTQALTCYTTVMRTREVPGYETVSETATREIQIAEE